MAELKNKQYEKFCQYVASGHTKKSAYVAAGYKDNRANAALLSKRPEIQARIRELKEQNFMLQGEVCKTLKQIEETKGDSVLDKKWVLDRLVENALASMIGNQRSAANRAFELLGKELGMFVDRSEVHTVGELAKLSDEELIKRLQEELDKPDSMDPDSLTEIVEPEISEPDSPPSDSIH